jgi:hypothetical protein
MTDANGCELTVLHKLRVPWPKVVSDYFEVSAAIDNNNQYRQGELQLEKIWRTHSWQKRFYSSTLGMDTTDAYLGYSHFNKKPEFTTIGDFTESLALALMRGSSVNTRSANSAEAAKSPEPGPSKPGLHQQGTHTLLRLSELKVYQDKLKAFKKKVRNDADKDKKVKGWRAKLTCSVCRSTKSKTSWYCVECSDINAKPMRLVCVHSETTHAPFNECKARHLSEFINLPR